MNILHGNENLEVVETLRKEGRMDIELLINDRKTVKVNFSMYEDFQEVTPVNEELTNDEKEIINNWLEWLRELTNEIEHPEHLDTGGR